MSKSTFIVGGMAALVLGGATVTHATTINEVPGNLFHQNGAAQNNNVSIAVNNPQNQGQGGWVGGNTNTYPVSVNSPILDGDLDTSWSADGYGGGAMANVSITQGYYGADANNDGFTTTPFAGIATIRVWANDHINDDNTVWASLPQQVKIKYTTSANVDTHNGSWLNSTTLGILPAGWSIDAPITAVNGVATSTITYGSDTGWTDLIGQFAALTQLGDTHKHRGYVDLTVNIPAGATSIMVSFGQPTAEGGLEINDIQAAPVPEPAGLGLISIGGLALLRRRAR